MSKFARIIAVAIIMGIAQVSATGIANAAPATDGCGTYEISGRLLNPALGRFEVKINEGSKGQYSVRVFGLKMDQAFDFVGSQVLVRGTVGQPVPGLLKSLQKSAILGHPELDRVAHHPVVLVEKADCLPATGH